MTDTDRYRDMGRLGGLALSAKEGPAFYQAIGKKGGATTKKCYGTAHYRAIGLMGGLKMKERGPMYFSTIGKMRTHTVRDLSRSIAIGNAVAVIRKAHGVSQRELAQRLYLSQSAQCNYERGQRPIPPGYLDSAAAALGVTVEAILREAGLLEENA